MTISRSSGRRTIRGGAPVDFRADFDVWEYFWITYWLTEFFCDLFATYTLGPAFAWSHLHLYMKQGGDAFELPGEMQLATHPADAARMELMLSVLLRAGFDEDASAISEKWSQALAHAHSQARPNYDHCYPDDLLHTVCARACEGFQRHRVPPSTTQYCRSDPHHSERVLDAFLARTLKLSSLGAEGGRKAARSLSHACERRNYWTLGATLSRPPLATVCVSRTTGRATFATVRATISLGVLARAPFPDDGGCRTTDRPSRQLDGADHGVSFRACTWALWVSVPRLPWHGHAVGRFAAPANAPCDGGDSRRLATVLP